MFFSLHDPATTAIYTLSLHDALPICSQGARPGRAIKRQTMVSMMSGTIETIVCRLMARRSEEHTSELQSRGHLVCRLLLEKKKINIPTPALCRHVRSHSAARSLAFLA